MSDESWVMRDMREKNDEWWVMRCPKNFCWTKVSDPQGPALKPSAPCMVSILPRSLPCRLTTPQVPARVVSYARVFLLAKNWLKNKKQNVKATTRTILVIQPSIQKVNVNISCQPLPSRLSHQCNVDCLQKLVACTWTCVPHAFKTIYIANTAKNPTKATIVSTYFANIHSAHIIQTMSMWSGMSTHWLCCPVLRPSFPPQPANIFCRRMMLQADTQGSASLSSLNPSANIRGASSLIN